MWGHGWPTSHEGFNYIISPENRWLEDDPVLLGPGNFSGAMLKLRGCTFQESHVGVEFQHLFIFSAILRGNDTNLTFMHIFQMGWFIHQL